MCHSLEKDFESKIIFLFEQENIQEMFFADPINVGPNYFLHF